MIMISNNPNNDNDGDNDAIMTMTTCNSDCSYSLRILQQKQSQLLSEYNLLPIPVDSVSMWCFRKHVLLFFFTIMFLAFPGLN